MKYIYICYELKSTTSHHTSIIQKRLILKYEVKKRYVINLIEYAVYI